MAKQRTKDPKVAENVRQAAAIAVAAMLAGPEHEGDWPPEVSRKDLETAYSWLSFGKKWEG